jgi:hypothetical protein
MSVAEPARHEPATTGKLTLRGYSHFKDLVEEQCPDRSVNIPPPIDGDEVFREFRNRLLVDYAIAFETWAHSATAADAGQATISTRVLETKLAAAQIRRVDLVWELARICQRFIGGDLYGWGFYLQRQGFNLNEILSQLSARAAYVKMETYDNKWRPGLRLLRLSPSFSSDRSWTDAKWTSSAWQEVVEESTADYIMHRIRPALLRRRVRHRPKISTRSRKRVERFILGILMTQHVRISRGDIAALAGYTGLTEVLRFQRDGKRLSASARKMIDRVLNYAPEQAVEYLTRLGRIKQRVHQGQPELPNRRHVPDRLSHRDFCGFDRKNHPARDHRAARIASCPRYHELHQVHARGCRNAYGFVIKVAMP